MTHPMTPYGDRYLVLPPAEAQRTKAGLYIPASAKSEDYVVQGTVVDRGPDADLIPVGTDVIFSRHSGVRIAFGERGDKRYVILREAEILGKLNTEVSDAHEADVGEDGPAV